MGDKRLIKVWDPFVRLFHWSLVGAFAICWMTEDEWMDPHVYAGYAVAALVLTRVVWGVIGTRYARFSDFVKSPSKVLVYLKDLLSFKAKRFIGHNPVGGAMIVILMFCLLLTVLTGMLAYGAEGLGPLAEPLFSNRPYGGELYEEIHEVFANLTLGLVAIHLTGVLAGSLLHQENLVRSMFTGTKRG
ncbi:MAG: cytochrome b/b6 domain-containing protein [Candidatus Thiodiazotropha taylori]|nr:cytochrome b/b6 domain-containing protein [Candidatus Thiodiazotropha taylori]MCG8081744.1 cytochrome b/b6 domain-containing protein [Candidatus Thiodiazotropha taylori]MCG8106960.1 cytochrome b/b6 domain-containing protein [Candidatus Thiodiazotropha taylori]MCG8113468.1 cytochrome b/b6 domain-containing protein [Candidatus Thiodiazotropha taylori]MCW4279297.1 cytochrome b/b6 domain-containing protein [Candidatus Thiodiazotropha taylori]